MASGRNGTLYLGVTNNLWRRVRQHKQGEVEGFSRTHGCTRLVWFEGFQLMVEAIQREKTMKGWPRTWKLNAIEALNPSGGICRTRGGAWTWRTARLDCRNKSGNDETWEEGDHGDVRGLRQGDEAAE
ncbi:MAG: GIY-YIG nuclease family protein [Caulobacteraceae bacterium]